MDQQETQVKLSIATKLLLIFVGLLILVIGTLNISTLIILRNDKKAYTYQAQSTSTLLAGREFFSLMRRALDTVKLGFASIDPTKEKSERQQEIVRSIIKNQTEIISLKIGFLDPKDHSLSFSTQVLQPDLIKNLQIEEADLELQPNWIKVVFSDLTATSYSFLNATKLGGTPLAAVLISDKNLAGGKIPIAIGFVSLKEFQQELGSLNLSIVTKSGWTLFDSDSTNIYSRKNIYDDPLFKIAKNSKLSSGASEYEADGTHYLGSYSQPGLDLIVLTKSSWQKAMKATYALSEKFILIGLLVISIAIVFAIFFAKSLTAPISKLFKGTKEIAQGNFNIQIQTKEKDEIGALTRSFNVMSRKISELIQEQLKKVQLENELSIASTVQQTLIPPKNFENENIFIRSHYQSASQCGGDWWGFFGVNKRLCLMIADATGHGLPSALITASARSCFSVMHKLAQEDVDFSFSPSAMLAYANRVIFDASLGKINMTFFISVIDFENKKITYSNAGHNPPWLFKKENDSFKLKSLIAQGNRLGETRDSEEFEEKIEELNNDDIIFLYTDGIIEGTNSNGEQYGKKRMRKMIESHVHGGPEKIIDEVTRDFLSHSTGKQLDDDFTLAVARFLFKNTPPHDLSA